MATRSTISVARPSDGKIISVYCHWDGYIEHNGMLLVNHYNSQELAEHLVSHGSISSLGERADPIAEAPKGGFQAEGLVTAEEHHYDNSQKGTTVYYGRDRGDEGTAPKVYTSLDEWGRNNKEEYNYLFIDGKWLCYQGWRSPKAMFEVAVELERKSDEEE